MKHAWRDYTVDELQQLHSFLYDLIAEFDRVCKLLHLPYFAIGGTAIGALYDKAILPWDDDVDLGMCRTDYETFLAQAPSKLQSKYILVTPENCPHTPYHFAKLRLKGTTFKEDITKNIDMPQGIYIDIFPFDKVPDNLFLQRIQREKINFLKCCITGKEVWIWKHCGKCEISYPTDRGWLMCFLTKCVNHIVSKKTLLYWLYKESIKYNSCTTRYWNNVMTKTDFITSSEIEQVIHVPFGPIKMNVVSDLETFLRRSYPSLHRYNQQEQEAVGNHCPYQLSFSEEL